MKRLLICLAVFGPVSAAAQQPEPVCTPTEEVHAIKVQGTDGQGRLRDVISPEIYGAHSFHQVLPNGWEFILANTQFGYRIGVYADGTDLTVTTPPRRGPNPRDIDGWHFRNADNTGPNTGDINAPQALRGFVVSPALADLETAGDGLGWLNILDYGLSDLAPDEKARMTYLKFDACVSWPKTEADKRREADAVSPAYLPEEIETFGSCGLDLSAYDMDARILPRLLSGDIDGDGSLDDVAQVKPKAEDRHGLAICRAGTWLSIAGLSKGLEDLPPGFVDSVEAWRWIGRGAEPPCQFSGIPLPTADGDILLLERIEKQAVAVYWRDGELRAKDLYHLVTE